MPEFFAFLFGISIGSFLNVCIYRIPRMESVVYPGSRCTACNARLGPADLIPLLSYIVLRGKCRHCGVKISPRYLGVEFLTGLIFVLFYIEYGIGWQAGLYLLPACVLIVASFIDAEHQIIPNGLVITGVVAALAANLAGVGISFAAGLYGMLLGAGSLALVAAASLLILKKEGMGGGDIKLMGMVGLFLGWQLTLLALMLAVFSGALISLLLLAFKILKRGDHIPFGPFLSLGSITALLYGSQILNWYLLVFWAL